LTGHEGWVFGVDVSADGSRVASGGYDKTARVWDVASGRQIVCFAGHTDTVRSVRFVRDTGLAISGGDDERLCVWGMDGREVGDSPSDSWILSDLAVLDDGHAISGSWDGRVRRWKLRP
jgi:WD40 repeat protein